MITLEAFNEAHPFLDLTMKVTGNVFKGEDEIVFSHMTSYNKGYTWKRESISYYYPRAVLRSEEALAFIVDTYIREIAPRPKFVQST